MDAEGSSGSAESGIRLQKATRHRGQVDAFGRGALRNRWSSPVDTQLRWSVDGGGPDVEIPRHTSSRQVCGLALKSAKHVPGEAGLRGSQGLRRPDSEPDLAGVADEMSE